MDEVEIDSSVSPAAAQYNVHGYYAGMNDPLRVAFRGQPLKVGQVAPSFCLPSVDGAIVNSDELLSAGHFALIFGCGSAPPAVSEAPAFQDLYERCPPSFQILYIYTREIHPNEPSLFNTIPLAEHTTILQKTDYPRMFRDQLSLTFPVLVDDLAGSTHRAFGGLPHFQVVVRSDGLLVHRAEWGSASQLFGVVDNLKEYDRQMERGHARSSYSETIWT